MHVLQRTGTAAPGKRNIGGLEHVEFMSKDPEESSRTRKLWGHAAIHALLEE